MGYCIICSKHYEGSEADHDEICGSRLPDFDNEEDRFKHEKDQQGWPDDMDKEIWDKHFRN